MKLPEGWLEDAVNAGIARLGSRAVAVDVGANTGTWTRPLSEVFASVIAVEPDARATARWAAPRNVVLVAAAAADTPARRTLYVRPSPEQSSLLEAHPIGAARGAPAPIVQVVEVPCVTLDGLCPQGADFVKMDIEGGEGAALRGCRDAGRWARTLFVVECHDTFVDVEAQLHRLGKRVSRIPHPLSGAHPGHCWAVGE